MDNATNSNTSSSGSPQVALITGATGNMGEAMVTAFLGAGYKVIGTVRNTETGAPGSRHENYEMQEVDVSDESAAAAFVADILNRHKQVDVAVLTVGGYAMGDISSTSTRDIEKQYKLNFETAYNVARPVFTHMLGRKSGRIFLVGSRPGLSAAAGKGMIAYSLAKSLIFRLAELMNDEAKGTGVVTSVVVPSTIDTPQNRSAMPKADFNTWVKPEAILKAVLFYCSADGAVLREPIIKVYNNA